MRKPDEVAASPYNSIRQIRTGPNLAVQKWIAAKASLEMGGNPGGRTSGVFNIIRRLAQHCNTKTPVLRRVSQGLCGAYPELVGFFVLFRLRNTESFEGYGKLWESYALKFDRLEKRRILFR